MNDIEQINQDFWLEYNAKKELKGLIPFGFEGKEPMNISLFDKEQLDWALDFAHACGEPIRSFNVKHTSYGLKHIAEKRARKLSDNKVGYITNGALILAMVAAGFRFMRKGDSPNVFFNVSERALRNIINSCNDF